MRVAVTGGSGRLGRATVRELLAHGHEVVNLDRRAAAIPGAAFTAIDVLRPADVLNGLNGCDAVVHLAGVPSPARADAADLFGTNVIGTWNVLEAAAQLGIARLCLASSINAVGMIYNREVRFDYLPLDEDHPCRPDETYGLTKLLGEQMAEAWVRRDPARSVSSMRYSYVATAEEAPSRSPSCGDGQDDRAFAQLWSIAVVEEVARANRLAIERAIRGHETYFITAAETSTATPSRQLTEEFFPHVPIRGNLSDRAPLISPAKAERALGWRHAPLQ